MLSKFDRIDQIGIKVLTWAHRLNKFCIKTAMRFVVDPTLHQSLPTSITNEYILVMSDIYPEASKLYPKKKNNMNSSASVSLPYPGF